MITSKMTMILTHETHSHARTDHGTSVCCVLGCFLCGLKLRLVCFYWAWDLLCGSLFSASQVLLSIVILRLGFAIFILLTNNSHCKCPRHQQQVLGTMTMTMNRTMLQSHEIHSHPRTDHGTSICRVWVCFLCRLKLRLLCFYRAWDFLMWLVAFLDHTYYFWLCPWLVGFASFFDDS